MMATMLLMAAVANAQSNNDPTIMTVNGQPVSRSEFEYSYNKNNAEGVIDKKNVEEYLDLFINYKLKVEAAKERILSINPACVVHCYPVFYGPDTAEQFDFTQYDYVVDAIDTVTGKLQLVEQAVACGTRIISSMGAGNKVDPSAFQVADLAKTSICPLARVMRKELKKRGIQHLKVVYSQEPPLQPLLSTDDPPQSSAQRRPVPGSNAFVPAAAGLVIAGEVVRELTGFERPKQDENRE
jgi:tRNA A37 threonylcarbamoyladenosine dehydratase